MARFSKPVLFSQRFGISAEKLEKAGLIDPLLDVDTQLFIDPILLEKSSIQLIREDALDSFRQHFENFIRLLNISEAENDVAWSAAGELFDLKEPPENGLGYGSSGRSGSSRPEEIQLAIMRRASEIIRLGSKDPEMISLMGFFEEGVGPDTISDYTTRVITDQLAKITEAFCDDNKIPTQKSTIAPDARLPRTINASGKEIELLLVPKDIVRELPIANDWSGIENATFHNQVLRKRVSKMLAGITKPTVADRKAAMREMALSSSEDFERFLGIVKEHAKSYDELGDSLGYYKLVKILAEGFSDWIEQKKHVIKEADDVLELALSTLKQFAHHVENGNLWEELWVDGKPKKERAAQLIYYAIAECYCMANDVDISPEANMGGGPIDFKFSRGFDSRVLVELKRSTGAVVHGYEKQLEFYKTASRTQFAVFVVMDYGDLDAKLTKILKIRKERIDKGERASEIIVIDASQKKSASKRK